MKVLQNIIKTISDFVDKNGKVIVGTITFSIITAFAKEHGYLSPSYGFTNNGGFKFTMDPEPQKEEKDWVNDPKYLPPVTNSFQQAVVALWRNGGPNAWESTKVDSAEKIARLIKSKDKITEADLQYAILAMSKISEKSTWSSTKNTINDLITKVVSTVTPVNPEPETNSEAKSDA